MEYTIRRARRTPELAGLWESPAWQAAEVGQIAWFHPKSTDHRPRTQFKILHDDERLYVFFNVHDRYVKSTRTDWQAQVCRDSCVEFFFEPKPDAGYFNIEINCGGTILVYYIEDESITPEGFHTYTQLPSRAQDHFRVYRSMPEIVYPEITEPTDWRIEYSVDLSLFAHYVGPLGKLAGQSWRGNLYKCGDFTSHPHWASWNPIGETLNFHQPGKFAALRFED